MVPLDVSYYLPLARPIGSLGRTIGLRLQDIRLKALISLCPVGSVSYHSVPDGAALSRPAESATTRSRGDLGVKMDVKIDRSQLI